jgi:hypothetical protein
MFHVRSKNLGVGAFCPPLLSLLCPELWGHLLEPSPYSVPVHTPEYLGYLAMRDHLPTFLESPPPAYARCPARCQGVFQSAELGEGLKRERCHPNSPTPTPHPPPRALTASESSNPGT